MAEEVSEKHPTENLVKEINKFTRDVEALRATLPVIMQGMEQLRKETLETVTNYLEHHGTKKQDKGEGVYTITMDHAGPTAKLKKQYENFQTAYRLIPRQFIISLISQYDTFLGQVVRFVFSVKPEALNASEKAITYADLINFADINDAQECIIEREIETVIRKNHADQFVWLKDRLNTSFNKGLACWPTFIELTERRNLFVHCDGRISSQYLRVCAEHKCNINPELKVGDQQEVPKEYFYNAYECIYEIGFKLAHVVWRRLCQDKFDASDENINETTFNLIVNGEYRLTISILEFFSQKSIKHSAESCRRTMLLNLAQAYKWSGNKEKCESTIASEDWSGWEDKYKIGAAVLRDDYDEAYRLVRCLKRDKEFHPSFYKQWPIFQELRKQREFQKLYNECYGEAFLVEESPPAEIKDDAE